MGLRFASAEAGDYDAKEKTYEAVRRFAGEFKAKNGSVVCREFLGRDIGTEEERNSAVENQLFDTRYPQLVRCAAEILEEIL